MGERSRRQAENQSKKASVLGHIGSKFVYGYCCVLIFVDKLIAAISGGDVLCHMVELLSGRILMRWEAHPKTRHNCLRHFNGE